MLFPTNWDAMNSTSWRSPAGDLLHSGSDEIQTKVMQRKNVFKTTVTELCRRASRESITDCSFVWRLNTVIVLFFCIENLLRIKGGFSWVDSYVNILCFSLCGRSRPDLWCVHTRSGRFVCMSIWVWSLENLCLFMLFKGKFACPSFHFFIDKPPLNNTHTHVMNCCINYLRHAWCEPAITALMQSWLFTLL